MAETQTRQTTASASGVQVLIAVGVGLFLVNLDATVLFVAFPNFRRRSS